MNQYAHQPVWAAFDFDGTLTRRDTLLPFLQYTLGTPRLAIDLLLESPWLLAYLSGKLSNTHTKQRLLRRCLGGLSKDELHELGEKFAQCHIPSTLRPAMQQRLQQHQSLGHTTVLVTASLTVYTEPWAKRAGFTYVIGSEPELDENGNFTGNLQHGNCFGAEKAVRLKRILPTHAILHAYGNSRGDAEMLAMAQFPHLLDKTNAFGDTLPSLS